LEDFPTDVIMSERASMLQHVPRGNSLAARSVLRRIKAFYDAEQAERVVRLGNQSPTEILWAECIPENASWYRADATGAESIRVHLSSADESVHELVTSELQAVTSSFHGFYPRSFRLIRTVAR